MLNNSGESGHPCLLPDIRGECFQFFTIENNVCCGLTIYGLYYVEIEPPYDPAIPLLGICPDETKTEKDTCTPIFIAAPVTIART